MSVTPDFVGQRYKDTTTGNVWIANSTTAGDWTLELQNMQVKWSPATINLQEVGGFWHDTGLAGITSITIEASTIKGPIQITAASDLTTLSAPYVTVVDGADYGYISITGNDALTSVSFPSLISTEFGVDINFNPTLTTIDLSSWVPDAGKTYGFNNNALNAATVNHILARCVANAAFTSGTISLVGGTNAAPSGQGVTDAATLTGRGCTIATN